MLESLFDKVVDLLQPAISVPKSLFNKVVGLL